MGSKGIATKDGAVFELYGQKRTRTWSYLRATANAGATRLYLQHRHGWRVGDELVVVTSDFHWKQNEKVKVTRVSGSSAVDIEPPLRFMHFGAGYERAEVMLINRNIKIQGDEASLRDEFGGHVIHGQATVKLDSVEFTRMGQRRVLGRYPIHFHLSQNVQPSGSYVKDCSIHDNFQRCLVLHDTRGALVQNNVMYNTRGSCLFLEDGGEINNILDSNVVVFARKDGNLLLPSDSSPGCMWITNPQNTVTNNRVAACTFGIWYALPKKPVGLTEAKYRNSGVYPRWTPMGPNKNNVAHTTDRGFMLDRGPRPDHRLEGFGYEPFRGTKSASSRVPAPNGIVETRIDNFVAWKCKKEGVWIRSSKVHFKDAKLIENMSGAITPGRFNLFTNLLAIANTANIGNPQSSVERSLGRTIPEQNCPTCRLVGYSSYDNMGPNILGSVTTTWKKPRANRFVGFRTSGGVFRGAIGQQDCERNQMPQAMYTQAVSLESGSQRGFMRYCSTDRSVNVVGSFVTNQERFVTHDVDGTLTGWVGGWLTSNDPVMLHNVPGCRRHDSYGWRGEMYRCPPHKDGFVTVDVDNYDYGNTNFGSGNNRKVAYIQNMGTSKRSSVAGSGTGYRPDSYVMNLVPRHGYAMTFSYATPRHLRIRLQHAVQDEWVIIAFKYRSSVGITVRYGGFGGPGGSNLQQASSVGNISPSRPWRREGEWVYLYVHQRGRAESYNFGTTTHSNMKSFDFIYVRASCSGTSCAPSNNNGAPARPPQETAGRVFRADLQPCQAGTRSYRSGLAFLEYNPATGNVLYTLNHNLMGHARWAGIRWNGASKASVFRFPQAVGPISGTWRPSSSQLAALESGRFEVAVTTRAHPRGEVIGQIGCITNCGSASRNRNLCNSPRPPAGSRPPSLMHSSRRRSIAEEEIRAGVRDVVEEPDFACSFGESLIDGACVNGSVWDSRVDAGLLRVEGDVTPATPLFLSIGINVDDSPQDGEFEEDAQVVFGNSTFLTNGTMPSSVEEGIEELDDELQAYYDGQAEAEAEAEGRSYADDYELVIPHVVVPPVTHAQWNEDELAEDAEMFEFEHGIPDFEDDPAGVFTAREHREAWRRYKTLDAPDDADGDGVDDSLVLPSGNQVIILTVKPKSPEVTVNVQVGKADEDVMRYSKTATAPGEPVVLTLTDVDDPNTLYMAVLASGDSEVTVDAVQGSEGELVDENPKEDKMAITSPLAISLIGIAVVVVIAGAVFSVWYVRRKANTGAEFFDVFDDENKAGVELAVAGSVPPAAIPNPLAASGSPAGSSYTVSFAYDATAPDELSLPVGETVLVSQIHDDGWATGSIPSTGASGVFPMSYVKAAAPAAVREAPSVPVV